MEICMLRLYYNSKMLTLLAKHENPVVRCYSLFALSDKAYPDLNRLFQEELQNPQNVSTQKGCIMGGVPFMKKFIIAYCMQSFIVRIGLEIAFFIKKR